MGKSFAEKCYAALKEVPKGKVTTYKELAHYIGSHAYRAVGTAMRNNSNPSSESPCHRVINSNGNVGEYIYSGVEKTRLLEKEGVVVKGGKVVNFKSKLYRFNSL